MTKNELGRLILAVMGAIAFIFLVVLVTRECQYSEEDRDPIAVELTEDAHNGFINPDAVVKYQQMCQQEHDADHLFLSIPPDILKNVAKVLIKKNGSATVDEILDEYLDNKDIYESLAKGEIQEKPEPSDTSEFKVDTVTINNVQYIRYESNSDNLRRE